MSSQAYTPSLQVLSRTTVRRIRELPVAGRALVKAGALVRADTPVLAAELPGELEILRIGDRLGFDPEIINKHVKLVPETKISRGELICSIPTFFGLFKSELRSPYEGTVEFYTEGNAHLGVRAAPLPLEVKAYIDGRVIEVEETKSVTVESEAALIQGVFGVGGERGGILRSVPVRDDEPVRPEHLSALELKDAILVGGLTFSSEALRAAAAGGVAAIITGSIDALSLGRYLGFEIGVSITGDEDVPCTLIITEGFGALALSERIAALCRSLEGRRAAVNGATQVRAGATRPELIVPFEQETQGEAPAPLQPTLQPGAEIRIIRVPFFGAVATIAELPSEPQPVESGAVVRVLKAKLRSGEVVTVPRANVELL